MKRILFLAILLVACSTAAFSQNLCGQSANLSVSAATTGQIVAAVGDQTNGTTIYVCGFVVTGSATATTAQFQTGTGTNCATNTVNLTQPMLIAANGNISFGGTGPGLVFVSSKGAALCLAATTGTVTVLVSYRTDL